MSTPEVDMSLRNLIGFGRLLCCLVGMVGLLSGASLGWAQSSANASVTFNVGPYIAFEFLSPPSQILIEVNDGGQAGTYSGSRPWRVQANVNWQFVSSSFSAWSPPLQPGWTFGATGFPTSGGGGTTLGTLTVQVSGLTFPTPPATYTSTVTVTIGPG
jgi:hypothetical protein